MIPVAGLGTRMLPATKAQPKEMLPVGIKPVVQHVVEELTAAGVKRVVFVTGRGKSAIENHFDADPALTGLLRAAGREELLARLDFERLGTSFSYVRQPEALGLGDAVLQAAPQLGGQSFLLALGDSIISRPAGETAPPVARRLAEAVEGGAACAVAVERVAGELTSRYGIAAPRAGEPEAESGRPLRLAGLVEKPEPGSAPSDLAVAGRYALDSSIFAELRGQAEAGPPATRELEISDAIARLIEAGERVVAVPLQAGERRLDTGTPFSYAAAFVEVALADPELGPELRRRVEELLGR